MKNNWSDCKNILCVRPDSMGDVLMTSPAFRALKESIPDVRLTLLTSQSGSAIALHIPEIDDIISVDFPWEKTVSGGISSKDFLMLVEVLKRKEFDGAIIFTVFSQNPLLSALLCYLSNIPRRLAYSHTKPYSLLTDWLVDTEPQNGIRHEVVRQLHLVDKIGAKTSNTTLSVSVPQQAKKDIIKRLALLNISFTNPIVVLHPGARSKKRQYDVSGFTEIANKLSISGYQVIITGEEQEQELVNQIIKNSPQIISLAGVLRLSEFIGLLSLSSLLISNNTGPVHIAAALKTPVVDLYALTNPQHTPWKVQSKVLYFDVAEDLRDEGVISTQIPENATRLKDSTQVVEEAIKLL